MTWDLYGKTKDDAKEYLLKSKGVCAVVEHFKETANKIAENWEKARPETAEEQDNFYVQEDLYLNEQADLHTRQVFRKSLLTMLCKSFDYLGVTKEDRILDFGGGIGTEILSLSKDGYKNVWLLELNPFLLEFAKWRAEKYDLKINIVNPRIPSTVPTEIKVIFSLYCLEHIKNVQKVITDITKYSGAKIFIEKSTWGLHGDGEAKWPQHSNTTFDEFAQAMFNEDWVLLNKPTPYYPHIFVEGEYFFSNIVGKPDFPDWIHSKKVDE